MLERRPMLGLLIGLTLCVSIWRITIQEPSMIEAGNNYLNQYQTQQQQQQQSQTYRQHTLEPQISSSSSSAAVAYNRIFGTTSRSDIQNSRNSYEKDDDTLIVPLQKWNESSINLSLASHQILSPVNYNYYDELPKTDFNSLIDLHKFKFIINQLPCRSSTGNVFSTHSVNDDDRGRTSDSRKMIQYSGPLVLILVHSAPNNYRKRLHIRETWGSLDTPLIRLIFLLGTVNDTKLQHKIELENNMFSDIVQGNFIDAYRNMTYKHVMALKWFTYYCPEAKFLLKIDDDVFVNTPYLIDFLNRYAQRNNLLFCEEVFWSRVKRSYRSKWRVSTKEFPGRYYPPYCPGYSIIYSPDIAYRLYQEAQKTSYFWIDDVHITGTLAQKSNITITSSSPFILTKVLCEKILNTNNNNNNYNNLNLENFLFLFSWPDIEEEQARNLWKIIERLR